MKFLIAGLGSIGRRHLRNLLALGERDIVLYRTHQSTLPDAELAAFPVETDLQKALDQRPDAVIVANPTAMHLDVAIPAAAAGCHLLLEKPVSHDMARLDELQAAAQRSGSRILVGFQFRFHPGLRKLKQLLEEGAIGRPLSMRAVYGEYLPGMHPWEDYRISYSARNGLGGGVILTLCHPIDYAAWILGDISQLWSFTGMLNDFELDVEDTAEIGLRFDNRAVGSIHLNFNQKPAKHELEVVGTQGTLRWDNASGAVRCSQGEGWQEFPPPADFERNHMFIAEMQHFLDVIRNQAAPLCTLDDGIRSLQIALAVQRSSVTGEPVHFSSDLGAPSRKGI